MSLVLCCVVLCCGFTLSDAEGHGDDSVGAGDAVQTADEVRQVVQNTQVVFHHDDVPETHDDHQSRTQLRTDPIIKRVQTQSN